MLPLNKPSQWCKCIQTNSWSHALKRARSGAATKSLLCHLLTHIHNISLSPAAHQGLGKLPGMKEICSLMAPFSCIWWHKKQLDLVFFFFFELWRAQTCWMMGCFPLFSRWMDLFSSCSSVGISFLLQHRFTRQTWSEWGRPAAAVLLFFNLIIPQPCNNDGTLGPPHMVSLLLPPHLMPHCHQNTSSLVETVGGTATCSCMGGTEQGTHAGSGL